MRHLTLIAHTTTALAAGILLGTWLFMLCFGPFGFLFFFSERLDPATLARLDALRGKPLALAMFAVGLLLARWVWLRAPTSRPLVVLTALVTGIPGVLWIALVLVMGQAVPNSGFGG